MLVKQYFGLKCHYAEYELPHALVRSNLSICLPISSKFKTLKCIEYNPLIDFSKEMYLWSKNQLNLKSIVLCCNQKFVGICPVVVKISDQVDEDQLFLTDRPVELSEQKPSFASATEMQYIMYCDFLETFDLTKIRFVDIDHYESQGPNILSTRFGQYSSIMGSR